MHMDQCRKVKKAALEKMMFKNNLNSNLKSAIKINQFKLF